MLLNSPDLSLATNLRRLSLLMQRWPGSALNPDATVKALNNEAPAVPVFWCFNEMSEYEALGRAVGPQHPLVGMRSLNLVMKVTASTAPLLDALAAHYAEVLIARFGRRTCIVGGNCQAASIAWRVAMQLLIAGVPVLRLVTLDAELRVPYPGHMRLLFGAESHLYNPFLSAPADPQRPIYWHWERAWRGVDWRFIPGPHGTYFASENISFVAQAILEDHSEPVFDPLVVNVEPSWVSAGGGRGEMLVEAPASEELARRQDLAVLPIWQTAQGGLIRVKTPDWIVPLGSGEVLRCCLRVPEDAVPARVLPILCQKGRGPLIWPGALSIS
jgi:hypothetical protein